MLLSPEASLAEDRYAFVRQYLARTPARAAGGTLFDIGAGSMPMKADVEAAGYEWLGFDLHPKSRDVAQWDVTTPFVGERRADVILLMDVIEHTYNLGIAMQNIARIMKPSARLLMTMPNPRWSRARTMHLYSGFIACFTQHDLDVNHHVFTPWPHIVLKLVLESGLTVEHYVTLDRDEIKLKRLSLASPALAIEGLVRKFIESRDPTARGMSYAFVVCGGTVDTKQNLHNRGHVVGD
jgi:SAM-dependent methyltransferase